jgi:hypothetical protein
MKTIPTQTQIADYVGNEILTKEGYAIYLASIVDKVADHFQVSKEDLKRLSYGHRFCHRSVSVKDRGTIMEQRVTYTLLKMQKDGFVSLIGGNFWQVGIKKYISRNPTAYQISKS